MRLFVTCSSACFFDIMSGCDKFLNIRCSLSGISKGIVMGCSEGFGLPCLDLHSKGLSGLKFLMKSFELSKSDSIVFGFLNDV